LGVLIVDFSFKNTILFFCLMDFSGVKLIRLAKLHLEVVN